MANLTAATPTVIPGLRYQNAVRAIDWLCLAFGFEKHLVVPGQGDTIAHAQLTFGNGMIMLGFTNEAATIRAAISRAMCGRSGHTTPGPAADFRWSDGDDARSDASGLRFVYATCSSAFLRPAAEPRQTRRLPGRKPTDLTKALFNLRDVDRRTGPAGTDTSWWHAR